MPGRKPREVKFKTRCGEVEIGFDRQPVPEEIWTPTYSVPKWDAVREQMLPYFTHFEGDLESGPHGKEIQDEPTREQIHAGCVAVAALISFAAELLVACRNIRAQEMGVVISGLEEAMDAAVHCAFQDISFDEHDPENQDDEPPDDEP